MCHNGGLRRVPGGEPAPTFALQSTRKLFVYIRAARAVVATHRPSVSKHHHHQLQQQQRQQQDEDSTGPGLPHEIIYDYVAPASYRFDYAVRDGHTGDAKTQWEHRDGDTVRGAYSLVDADGTTRIVEYTADPHNGFRAEVKRLGHPAPPPPQPTSGNMNDASILEDDKEEKHHEDRAPPPNTAKANNKRKLQDASERESMGVLTHSSTCVLPQKDPDDLISLLLYLK
ncbi:uncharacterized protein LOC124594603 [Schistocerca americana]|uniref:uncharacterized protein LOC124594603 n=1 Tax=Schistocerca americana TaxID=7009 RepID=UPI001F4F5D2E|nr:uncharacterized protein LOC124594603 [Schistocerca americana]